jgi:peptidoglycan LD-endopeptidase CwlK
MSVRLFPDDLRFEQRLLKSAGFYVGKIDGKYGLMTMAAEDRAEQEYLELRKLWGTYDARSEKNIATLLPKMQVKARQILKMAADREKAGAPKCVILSGTRTYAEQNVLYAKGRTAGGNIVTNARGGQSNHNFGVALDVGLFSGTKYLTGASKAENKAYEDLAHAIKGEIADVAWGGDWRTFKDLPHFEYATGINLAQVRAAFEAGALTLA